MNHDDIIEDIVNRLYYHHSEAEINHNQKFKYGRVYGECDASMIDKELLYVIEVKSRDTAKSRYKAKEQLKKDIEYYTSLYNISQIWAFYAYSDKHKRRGYEIKKIYHIKEEEQGNK